MRSASSLETRRADINKSSALAWPTMRGNIQLMPCSAINPRRADEVVETALSAAKGRSQYNPGTGPTPAAAAVSKPKTGLAIEGEYDEPRCHAGARCRRA